MKNVKNKDTQYGLQKKMQTAVDKSDTAVTIKDFVNRLHVSCVDEVKK